MAKRTGTPGIWKAAKKIAQLQQQLGASDLTAKLGQPFTDAVNTLVGEVIQVKLNDDYPLLVDRTPPAGPEDV